MGYYWFNKEKLLKHAWDKYHNKGGKQKVAKLNIMVLTKKFQEKMQERSRN